MPQLGSVLSTLAAFAVGVGSAGAWIALSAESQEEALNARLDAAVGELRREVRERPTRVIERPLAFAGASERDDEPRAVFPGMDGDPEGDGEDEDAPPELPSPEEREAEMAARVATLEEAMNGPNDISWSSPMEESVGGALERYRGKLPEEVASAVEAESTCSSGLCRVELSFPDGRALERHGMSFYPPRGLSRGFVRFTNDAETRTHKMLAYYAKEADDLP